MTRSTASFLVATLVLTATAHALPGPVGSEFEVDVDAGGTTPDVAFDGAGRFVAVWLGSSSPHGTFVRRFDAAGEPLGSELLVATGTDPFPAVAARPSGSFLVVWSASDGSGAGVFGRLYDDTGSPTGPAFPVNTTTADEQEHPDVVVDPAGGFVIVWSSEVGTDNSIVARRFDAAGMPLGPELPVSSPTVGNDVVPALAPGTGGSFLAVWLRAIGSVYYGLYGQLVDGADMPVGGEIEIEPLLTGGNPGWPDVAADSAGTFTVVFRNSSGVVARRYDGSGTPVGGDIIINGGGNFPAVASAATGESVVSWEDYEGTSPSFGSEIFSVRVSAGGALLGSAFLTNTFMTDDQVRPAVAIAPDSGFVVLWTSPQREDGAGILGQRYDSAGMPAPGYVPVSGAQLLVKDPGDPARRSVKVRSVDPEIGNGINTVINPAADGAFLHVFNSNGTGDSACFSLPASGWVSIGTPEDPLYVYRDVAHANGPCSVARIRRNKYFRVTCRAASQPIPYTLDEAAQGSVASALTIGPATYCTDFGGAVLLDDGATGRFKAKLAPAPAACPVAPAPCP